MEPYNGSMRPFPKWHSLLSISQFRIPVVEALLSHILGIAVLISVPH